MRTRRFENCAAQARLAVSLPTPLSLSVLGRIDRRDITTARRDSMTMRSIADSTSWQQRRWCLRKDLTTQRLHKRVCLRLNFPNAWQSKDVRLTSRPAISPRYTSRPSSRTMCTVRFRYVMDQTVRPCDTNVLPDIFVDNVHIELSLWDTAGQEEFDRLRSLSYGRFFIRVPVAANRIIRAMSDFPSTR